MKGERKKTTLSEELEWSDRGRRVKPSEGSDPPEEKPDMSVNRYVLVFSWIVYTIILFWFWNFSLKWDLVLLIIGFLGLYFTNLSVSMILSVNEWSEWIENEVKKARKDRDKAVHENEKAVKAKEKALEEKQEAEEKLQEYKNNFADRLKAEIYNYKEKLRNQFQDTAGSNPEWGT